MYRRLVDFIKSERTWSAGARRLDAEYRKRFSDRNVHIDKYEWMVEKIEHQKARRRIILRALIALFVIACAAYVIGAALKI
jgi:thymidylate synthase